MKNNEIIDEVQSWGRYPLHSPLRVETPAWRNDISLAYQENILGFGNGRSYGDSCHNSGGVIIHCALLNRMLAFDETTGVLTCEAGVLLADILAEFVPRGWFLSVTPGTKYVTVGGAIANDVHGKNHHCAGTFGCHTLRFGLLRSDGEEYVCSPDTHADLYRATIGGMGLTGIITWAEIRLRKIETPFIAMESQKFSSLDEFFELSNYIDSRFPYTVSWTDCASYRNFGRGIMMAGEHAVPSYDLPKIPRDRKITFPFDAPSWMMKRYASLGFNIAYYHSHFAKIRHKLSYIDHFFYPLDAVLHWNRIYGKRGFLQYQFHVPFSYGRTVVSDIINRIARSGEGSFLAVLKIFGSIKSSGIMSFPREGINLALDFSYRGAKTLSFLSLLDEIVAEAGGAVYPAKDARMSGASFRRFYPQWEEFAAYIDPKFNSDFWRRVTES